MFIDIHSSAFSIKAMLGILGVSSSGFYDWRNRCKSQRAMEESAIHAAILRIRENEDFRSYGSPRMCRELNNQGFKINEKRTARIMKKYGIKAVSQKKIRIKTTDSNHDYPISDNLLQRDFKADAPNKVWVSDITYVKTSQGWLYLCVIIDLFSRKVVGWAMREHMRKSLVIEALDMAVLNRSPGEGLVYHSDRGSQYASYEFRNRLASYEMLSSMSAKGDCWDNACAESFFHTLKTELVHHMDYKTFSEAKNDIFRYIETFYNRRRLHSYLDYLSPEEFERRNVA